MRRSSLVLSARGVPVRLVVLALCTVYGCAPDVRLIDLHEAVRRWS